MDRFGRILISCGELLMVAAIVVAVRPGRGQSPMARPKFEVASIKPSPPGRDMVGAHAEGGRMTLQNYTLRGLIRAAYGVRPSELFGGPPWIESARYDIVAKSEKRAGSRELWRMVHPLLEERFRLRIHHEKRQVPVLNLVIAKGGKLAAARQGSCVEGDAATPYAKPEAGKPLLPHCGSMLLRPGRQAGLQLTGGKVHTADLANYLTDLLGRHVIDQTGLTGAFDIDMRFASDDTVYGSRTRSLEAITDLPDTAQAGDPSGMPSIFMELRTQLGLRLVPGKGLIDVLVIDSIEKPSAN